MLIIIICFQNRVFVTATFKHDLREIMEHLFCQIVMDPVIDKLLSKYFHVSQIIKIIRCYVLNSKSWSC